MGSRLAAVVVLLAFTGAAAAQDLGGATRLTAVSGAAYSYGTGTSALYGNPAGMSQTHQYMVEGGYTYVNAVPGHRLGAAVVDSSTNQVLAVGAGYTWLRGFGADSGQDLHRVVAGLSSGMQAGDVGVYVGGAYTPLKTVDGWQHDATVGAIVSIAQMVRLGVAGVNLMDPKPGSSPRSLVAGISFGGESFIAAFDTTFDFTTRDKVANVYAIGAEYFFAGMASVRAGYRIDRVAESQSFSLGVGLLMRTVGLEVAYAQNPKESADNRVQASMVFFVP
jgi:hypothetical protein